MEAKKKKHLWGFADWLYCVRVVETAFHLEFECRLNTEPISGFVSVTSGFVFQRLENIQNDDECVRIAWPGISLPVWPKTTH